MEFVAVCDIRPSNQKRIFEGENPPSPRKGFNRIYGKNARGKIKVYEDYRWGPHGEAAPTFSIEELKTIVETARSSGRPVTTHSNTGHAIS